MTFDGEDLYPSIVAKTAALGFFVIQNHLFVDGNKCMGHAGMETLLVMNGYKIDASAMVFELAMKAGCDYIVTYNQRDFAGVEQAFQV